jgi:hypothetical protein
MQSASFGGSANFQSGFPHICIGNIDEVQVIEEKDMFPSVHQYLEKELTGVEEGTAKYTTIEALGDRLDDTLREIEAF